MKPNQLKILKAIPLHLVFWVLVWFFFAYVFSFNYNNRLYIAWFASLVLPVTIAVTYFMVYYLIPKYLLPKKHFQFALNCFYTFVFSTNIILPLLLLSFFVISKNSLEHMPLMSRNIVFMLVMIYLIVGLVSFVNILNLNYKTTSQNKELQNKILEAQLKLKEQELQYLKMQIHPHFLFNTLNTIYGMAMKQSEHTPELILKLSNLLDYILYEINKPLVRLTDEIEHIKEYIDLEKTRFQDTLLIKFQCPEIDEKYSLAPMILLPFVENAFKHGEILNGYLSVSIDIKIENNTLYFIIENTTQHHTTKTKTGGIGLVNIKKRLELNYPEKYKLEINDNEHFYKVSLRIEDLLHG